MGALVATLLTAVVALLINRLAAAQRAEDKAEKDTLEAKKIAEGNTARSENAETLFRADLMRQFQTLADRLDEQETRNDELKRRLNDQEEERAKLREQARQLIYEREIIAREREELRERVTKLEDERTATAEKLAKAQADLENAQRLLEEVRAELNTYRERLAMYESKAQNGNGTTAEGSHSHDGA